MYTLWRLHRPQRTEAEISTCMGRGARRRRRHLAIANVQQSHLLHTLPELSDGGNIPWVIGTLSRQNLGCYRHSQCVDGGKDRLHLRQVRPVCRANGTLRPMIFGGSKLKQTSFYYRPVAAGPSAVETHALRVQIVYPQQVLVQCRLKLSPALIIAGRQQNALETIVAKGESTHSLTGTTFQCLQGFFSAVFNVIEPVTTQGKDVGQPDRTRPTQANLVPIAMPRKVLIQRGLHTHPSICANIIRGVSSTSSFLMVRFSFIIAKSYHNFQFLS